MPTTTTGAAPVPGPGEPYLFSDAHGFLRSVATEVRLLREKNDRYEAGKRAEIQELEDAIEKQRQDRKDTMARLRYEFEEFVHRKIDKVLEEVEEMKRTEHGDDQMQQNQIDRIHEKVDMLKQSLFFVQAAWGKLVSQCLNPDESVLRGLVSDV